MRSIRKYIFLSLFAVILLLPSYAEAKRAISIRPTSPSGAEVTGNQWLFVIGIDTYLNWPRLNTAVSDAKSIRNVLLSDYYFDKQHLIELYDEQATRKNIIGKLRYLARIVRKNDSLVIFYAGHGHLDSVTKAGSWIPIESGVEDASAWISNHDIKNYLKVDVIKAKHILLISDSCFSGDFFRGHRGKLPVVTDKVIKKAYQLSSRQAITSGGLEPVVDEGFGKNSVFSHFLIKTLRENNKPFLIPSDFFPDIKAGVVENAEQLPRLGSLIGTGGQQGGELVFFLKQDSRFKALSAGALARKKELQRLEQMEIAAEETRKKEAEEIAKHEKEIAKLDVEIERMRKRLGTTAVKRDDSLDSLLAMVHQKQEQKRRLEGLKKKRQQEKARRRAEIERLKTERRKKLIAALKEDIRKYQEIVSSPFGKDMKEAAWKSLVGKYPEAGEDIEIGDTRRLLAKVKWSNAQLAFTNSIGMNFVLIPSGTFMMGSPSDDLGCGNDERRHRVTLSEGFYIQTTEVTQGQWQSIMGSNPSRFKNCGDDCSIEKITWNDAQDFIRRLNHKEGINKYRLPTEAEWEYACRAGSENRFCFGNSGANLGEYAWYNKNSGKRTHPVGVKKPNTWGLYDMHGNVWEWCEDWYGDYPASHVTDPKGPSSGNERVLRGGSWNSFDHWLRSANRFKDNPRYRRIYIGFRVARDF